MQIPKKHLDTMTPETQAWVEEHPNVAAVTFYTGAATPWALLLGAGYLVGRVLIKVLR